MIIHDWMNPDTVVGQFIAAFPGFRDAVETAAAKAAKQLDGSHASTKRKRQAFADFFRFFLVDELTRRGLLADEDDEPSAVEIRAGNRNSLVLTYNSVSIRSLRAKDNAVPSAGSRKRVKEWTQPLFESTPTSVRLVLLWEITEKGIELELNCPKAAGEKTKHSPVHWSVPIPHSAEVPALIGAGATVVDIASAQDLDEYALPKQDVKEESNEPS